MKPADMRALWFFLLAGATVPACAQKAAPKADMDRCADWVRTVAGPALKVNPTEFCAGIRSDGPALWHSDEVCGGVTKPGAAETKRYCTFSGALGEDWTIAAGFVGAAGDGGELLREGNSGAAATLYSRTPLLIGKLRLPAGLYKLSLSKSPDSWKMTVAPEDAGQAGGTVALTADTDRMTYTGNGLSIGVHFYDPRCADPLNVRELVFTYHGMDLYTCMRPDHIPPARENAAQPFTAAK